MQCCDACHKQYPLIIIIIIIIILITTTTYLDHHCSTSQEDELGGELSDLSDGRVRGGLLSHIPSREDGVGVAEQDDGDRCCTVITSTLLEGQAY